MAPIPTLSETGTKRATFSVVYDALTVIEGLLNQNMIRLRSARQPGVELRDVLKKINDAIFADVSKLDEAVEFLDIVDLKAKAATFAQVVTAELQIADIYVVTARGGFDTTHLAENGHLIFPPDLIAKVPGAMNDAKNAGRCIAFDLPTAAAFHMHRANEAVLHEYYDAVSNGKTGPTGRSMELWIQAIEAEPGYDKKVVSALRDLKDLHRNPVAHPEQSLASTDEAIALLGSVNSAMLHMLKAI